MKKHNKSFKRDWAQKAAPNPLIQPLYFDEVDKYHVKKKAQ